MKNRFKLRLIILTVLNVFLLVNNTFAQIEEIYKAGNGTEIPVKFKSLDPDDIFKLNVHVGPSYQAGKLYFGGVSYELPSKLFLHAQFGANFEIDDNGKRYFGLGTNIEANYFFLSKKKPSKIKRILKSEYMKNDVIARYVMEKALEKRVSHGIHLGFIDAGIETPQILTYNTYVIGYSRLTVKQLHLLIGKIKIKKRIQTFSRFNADLLIHRNIKSYDGRTLVDNDFPTYGARLYYDTYFPLWLANGRSNIHITFGLETLVDPEDDWNLNIIFGFGYGHRLL